MPTYPQAKPSAYPPVRKPAPYKPSGRQPPHLALREGLKQVDDPYEPGRQREVPVNRHVDVLENELARKRIDTADYAAGQRLKRAYERLPAASSGSNWRGGSRPGPIEARNRKEDRHIDAMMAVEELEAEAKEHIGKDMLRMLQLVLRDGLTFTEIAARAAHHGSTATVAQVADRFRWSLRCLANKLAAVGPDRGRIVASRVDPEVNS